MRTRRKAAGTAALLILAAAVRTASSQAVDQFAETYWCGTGWVDADDNCRLACPTGDDEECSSVYGDDHSCYFFTSCASRVDPVPEGDDDDDVVPDGSENNFCGDSWLHAMLTCKEGNECPNGNECDELIPPSTCYAATGCDRPLQQLVSELLTTLAGPDEVMQDDEDIDLFGGTIFDFISVSLTLFVFLLPPRKSLSTFVGVFAGGPPLYPWERFPLTVPVLPRPFLRHTRRDSVPHPNEYRASRAPPKSPSTRSTSAIRRSSTAAGSRNGTATA